MLTPYKKILVPVIIALGRRRAEKHFTRPPVLIGGCGRSGTTLLLSILSSHPELFACQKELSLFKYWRTNAGGHGEPERIDRLYTTFLRSKIGKDVNRWCEKTPNNIRHLDRIDAYFRGNFRFIQIIRDGRDVILSRHPSSNGDYYVEPARWVEDVTAGLSVADHPCMLTIKYESLVQDYIPTMKQVLRHLDLSMTDEILSWFHYSTVRKNPAYFSGLEKLHSNSIGRWKDPVHRERVDALLDYPGALELLKKLNYI
jgi:hypothetical protein